MDQKLLFLINREWTSTGLDKFMAAASSFGLWFWPLVLLGMLVWVRGGFTARALVVTLAIVIAINDGLVAKWLKRSVDRPRPHETLSGVRQVDLAKAKPRSLALFRPLKIRISQESFEAVTGRSFPSSHVMNTFGAATVCASFYRRRGWLAFSPAGVVAYSRIYTGAHWPSDILISIFLGIGVTCILLAVLESTWKFAAKCWPCALCLRHPSLFPELPRS
jgi:undecaprenyl-diphosphatase